MTRALPPLLLLGLLPRPALAATSGDGRLDTGEACDDHNTDDDDGCDHACVEENGWDCVNSDFSVDATEVFGDPSGHVSPAWPLPSDKRTINQRRAWFAYNRVASIVRYLSSASFIHPADTEVDRSSDTVDDLVILELRGLLFVPDSGRAYPYGYVLLVDAWRDTADRFVVSMSPSSGTSGEVLFVNTVPQSIGTPSIGSSSALPYAEADFNFSGRAAETFTLSIPYDLEYSFLDGPVLILSSKQLTWSVDLS